MSSKIFPEMGVQGDPKFSRLDKDYYNNNNKDNFKLEKSQENEQIR